MEKPIEKGLESVGSVSAIRAQMQETHNQIMEKLHRIDELITIRFGKGKPHDYNNTTASHVPRCQDSAKAATPPPHPPPVYSAKATTPPPLLPPVFMATPSLPPPVLVTTPPSPHSISMATLPSPHPAKTLHRKPPVTATTLWLPTVSMTILPHVPVTMWEPLPLIAVMTPPSLVDAVIPVASAPPEAIVAASFPTRFFPTKELINVQQGEYGFIGPHSLKTWQIWDVF